MRHGLLGHGLSLFNNPFIGSPPASNLPLGLAALEKGKAVGAKTQRERDYVDALAVFYTGYDKTDHRTRIQAYVKAMERLEQRYPNDDEAQMYYALALNVAARRRTRPTRTSSRPHRSWKRCSSASRITPASRIT